MPINIIDATGTTQTVNTLPSLGAADAAASLPVVVAASTSEIGRVLKGQQSISDCTISSGQSLSALVDLGVYRLVGLSIPATFEPTTLTFQSSYDGTTWMNVYDSTGVEKSATVAASRRVIIAPSDFYGIRYIKIRGGTSSASTTVSADRIIKIIAEA